MQAFMGDIAKAVGFILVVVGLTRFLEVGVRKRAEAVEASASDPDEP